MEIKWPCEPEFTVTDLPEEKMEVTLQSDPSFCGVFEEGFRFEWYFYDYPEKRLTTAVRTECLGKILIDGEECYEFSSHECDGEGKPEMFRQSYYALRGDEIHCIRWIMREPGKTAIEEEVEGFIVPRKLSVGYQGRRGPELYRCGDRVRNGGANREMVTGAALVDFGLQRHRCLRYFLVTDPQTDGERLLAAEMYINESGLCVLFRRYNGRGWYNLEQLKDCRQIEWGGEIYYHWYNCIPDYAFLQHNQT